MIECTFINDTDNLTLNVKGHADYAEHGKDIVCSAVSTLFFALAEYLNSTSGKNVHINTAKEIKSIKYTKCEANNHDVEVVFFAILGGIEQISRQYPDNVSVSYIVEGR